MVDKDKRNAITDEYTSILSVEIGELYRRMLEETQESDDFNLRSDIEHLIHCLAEEQLGEKRVNEICIEVRSEIFRKYGADGLEAVPI